MARRNEQEKKVNQEKKPQNDKPTRRPKRKGCNTYWLRGYSKVESMSAWRPRHRGRNTQRMARHAEELRRQAEDRELRRQGILA